MRKHNANYVVVGLFIVVMVAGALASATLLAGRTGARDSYYTLLDNVADVAFGTQVRYDGYPIGQVEEIMPVAEGARMRFRVAVSVERGWRIPADSVARIGSTSFLAAKTVDIQSGAAQAAIAAGGEIPSGAASDIFATMSVIAAEFGDLNQDSIKPLIDRVALLVDQVGGDLQRDLGQLLGSLNSLAGTIDHRTPELLGQVDGLVGRLDSSAASLQQVLSPENAQTMQSLLANAELASRDLSQTMIKVDHLVTNLDGLAADNRDGLDQSLEDVQYTLSSVARNIDSIVHNLEGSSRNMNEFSRLIRQNPGLLLNGTPREEVSSSY